MRERDKPLRDQMDDAMAAIRRQLELLRAGPNLGGPDDNGALIAELEAEYEALKAARDGRGVDDR